jgi:hypothetical protein
MRHANHGESRHFRTTTHRGRIRPILEELEPRITPSTGPYFHLKQVLSAQISSPTPGLDANTTVTIDAAGHVAVFWQDSLFSAANPVANPVIHGEVNGSPAFTVSTGGSINAAAADASGDVAVAWQTASITGGPHSYYVSFYSSSGAALGRPVNFSNTGYDPGPISSIAGDSAGHFMVAWQNINTNGSVTGIDGQVFDAHGNALTSAFAVSSVQSNAEVLWHPAVAADSGGGFVVLWMDDRGFSYQGPIGGIDGQRYDAAGNAVGAAFVVYANTDSYWDAHEQSLHVASDGAGNLVAVWSHYTGHMEASSPVFKGILGQRFTDQGVLQGSVFHVHDTPVSAGSTNWIVPTVAMDGADDVEVVYASGNPDSVGNSVYVQGLNPAGNSRGALARLNTMGDIGGPYRESTTAIAPTVAANPAGDFVFGWAQNGNATAVLYTGAGSNRAPQALAPIAAGDVTAFADVMYYESQSYFSDPDRDPLAYSATLANGNPLPAWLHIDNDGRLWGAPDASAAGTTYQVRVTATDPYWASASLVLPLTVRPDARMPAGGEVSIDPAGMNDWGPVTASNSAGESLVVWQVTNSNGGLMGQVYDIQHRPIGPAFSINAPDGFRQAVTADAAGNFDIAWSDGNSIYLMHISNRGAALDNAVQVVAQTATDCVPHLAADATGGLVLTWVERASQGPTDPPPGVEHVFVQRFDVQGNPLSAGVRVSATGEQPAVAVSPNGKVLVAWVESNAQVMTQLFDAHLRPLTSPAVAGPAANLEWALPVVAADGLGNFDVAWVTGGAGQFGDVIDVERFNNQGAPILNALGGTGPVPIAVRARGDQESPTLAADQSGNFAVFWTTYQYDAFDRFTTQIFGQRYSAAGQQVGSEFQIAGASHSPDLPTVAVDAAGNLMIAWMNLWATSVYNPSIHAQWFWPTTTVHIPGAQTTSVNTALVFSTANGNAITITGGDPTQVETLTLHVNEHNRPGAPPTLMVTHITGLASITGNGTTAVTLTGTRAALNASLQGLTFHPAASALDCSLDVTLAANGAMTVSNAVPITVRQGAPQITLPAGPLRVSAGSSLVFAPERGDAITVADPGAGTSLDTLTLWVTNGTLTLASTAGPGSVRGNGTGVLRVSGTLSQLNAALNGLIYTPAHATGGRAFLNAYLQDSAGAVGWATVTLTINAV